MIFKIFSQFAKNSTFYFLKIFYSYAIISSKLFHFPPNRRNKKFILKFFQKFCNYFSLNYGTHCLETSFGCSLVLRVSVSSNFRVESPFGNVEFASSATNGSNFTYKDCFRRFSATNPVPPIFEINSSSEESFKTETQK